MKHIILLALTFTCITISSAPSFAGPCDHDWQTASDGSRCGNRSADARPGGR